MVRTEMKTLSFVVGLFALASVIGWAAPTRAALVHLYTFNTDAKDFVGHLDGTLQGGASLSGGQVHFNPATSGYVSFGSNDIATMSAVTIEVWGTYATSNPNPSRIAEFGSSTGFLDLTPVFVEMLGCPTSSDFFYYTSSAGTGTPVFVAVTIAGTTMTAYVNGLPAGSMTLVNSSLSAVPTSAAMLGRSIGGGQYLDGSIDELRIYNNARSASEIAADYAAGPNAIPEPTTLCLMGSGLLGLLCYAWRKRR